MTEDQHNRLSAIVGCGSEEGFAEVDQVEDAYARLRVYEEVILPHYNESHSLPDICCPDLEAALDILRKRETSRSRTSR